MANKEMHRLYEIIAYDEYFNDLMFNIMHLKNCRWYWSYHDKDTNDDGTLKDHHWHILIYFDNACTISALMKKIDFDKEHKIKFFKKGSDEGRLDYRVRYLIHYKSNDTHKHEYPRENIHTNDDNIDKFFDNEDNKTNSDITLIFDYFDRNENIILSYRNFLNYIFSNNLWSTYRKNAVIFNRLFDEHNTNQIELLKDVFK